MAIKFAVSKKRLKWKWVRQMEQPASLNAMMAACMVDETGEYYPAEQAQAILDDLDLDEIEQVAKTFRSAVDNYVIPPESAAS